MSEGPIVRVTRRFNASPERVFDAWLDTAMIGRFMFGAHLRDEQVVSLSNEPRVGGRFSYKVTRQGQLIDHMGTYCELGRPRRLVFTWGVDREENDKSIVIIELASDGNDCVLTLTHRIDPAFADYAERTEQGWSKITGDLANAL